MDPAWWGPGAWRFLHAISFTYPLDADEQDQAAVGQLLESLARLLPCAKCRPHWERLIHDELPYHSYLYGRHIFSQYMVEVHNRVNDRLGKPRYAYEDACRLYTPNAPAEACRSTIDFTGLPVGAPSTCQCGSSRRKAPVFILIVLGALVLLGLLGALMWWWFIGNTRRNRASDSSALLSSLDDAAVE